VTTIKDEPLVSVIIPTRNSEDTLERCLESVESQSYKNVEIIVVDNYSSDKTREIADKFKCKVLLKDHERSIQVNFGAKNSKGKYLYRVDSDFILDRRLIQEAVRSAENHNYDAIIIHNTSDPTISFWSRVRKAERDCYKGDDVILVVRFYRRKVFDTIGGYDENLLAGEDYDFSNRLLREGCRIGRITPEEVHIGEPKTLADIVRKSYFYGKSINRFINKNSKRGRQQLNPFRRSYLRHLNNLTSDPIIFTGFVFYQGVRYLAAFFGMFSGT
jgi:glycosyltransferase involved in cell wall biosynthesis